MRTALRVLLILLLIVAGAAFGAARYYLGREPIPEKSDYTLDLNEIRRLATAMSGPLPTHVNHEQVAEASLPVGAVFAGESLFKPHPMTHGAYQVVYPDGYVLIDSSFDAAALHVRNPETPFSDEAWNAIQKALGGARAIVITHEHPDHIGGIARFAEPDKLVGRLYLTKEQLANDAMLKLIQFPDALRSKVTPLAYEKYYALAPGMVLVKAAGHTPGSQMVFVKLENGKELLFLGDVAWHMDQIEKLWYRPRLITDVYIHENRAQVMGELRTLHDLHAKDPLILVASHDVDERKALIASGDLGAHFEF
jgi:glyoxylase-like metal-dependent hydrolase (beta-lactamase superfamily II)